MDEKSKGGGETFTGKDIATNREHSKKRDNKGGKS